MTDIYCHIHTPINIEEENTFFTQPLIFDGTLYIIKERKLQDALFIIGYFREYIGYIRENGYESISRWLGKKKLLNDGFLEAVSQYWIPDIPLKNVYDYTYFQKNDQNKPVISEKYLKNIFKKVVLYSRIKEYKDKFNEDVEKILDTIENELYLLKEEKNFSNRQRYYQNKFFGLVLDNFIANLLPYVEDTFQEIDNINFSCENFLSQPDLSVYKISSIKGYKDYNFELAKPSHKECLNENTFVKLHAESVKSSYGEDYMKYFLERLREYSINFTKDNIDFGVGYLKKMIGNESSSYKKNEIIKSSKKEYEYSNIALLQKTQTIISETEDHIISRYNSLKNYTNIYFAPDHQLVMLLAVLNMDKLNLIRANNLIWENQNKIETELVKFAFKKGNLPYSSFGFASINF